MDNRLIRALGVTAIASGAILAARAVWANQSRIAFGRPLNEWTFSHMDRIMPTAPVPRGGAVRPLRPSSTPMPRTYEVDGARRGLDELHRRTNTTSMVVLHRGELTHETYPGRFANPDRRMQLFSVSKSVTSILTGIAIEEGLLSLSDRVRDRCWWLVGSAFSDVTLEQLLDMSSGVGDLEDWNDPNSLLMRFDAAASGSGDIREVARVAERTRPAGTAFNYSTVDTQVIGWMLESASGMSLAEYASARLLARIGAERDGYYFLTRKAPRAAIAGGSLNLTSRDLARIGHMMSTNGRVGADQIVDPAWVERGRTSEYSYLQLGELGMSGYPEFGYANQWWTLGGPTRAFCAIGVHGQYLFVDPEREVVIAKTSAWSAADDLVRNHETVRAFESIAAQLAGG
ncbi:MAG TPA: serine hydrolase [Microbacterium sp.]|uniref:serine hydrolase domain-containing protein n=1 Tax=Microbacterium sp. TaxID=51671 RepID=UPI002C59C018|nr:serine hydrolase [Microbacterium sp.]HWI30042.1 serine hydrolase [Microbacterium sp.]